MNEPEWQHLEAVVDELAAADNPCPTPFTPSQGGWWCSMSKPLDPDTARWIVARDTRLTYEESDDTLSCRHCWTSIYGATVHRS